MKCSHSCVMEEEWVGWMDELGCVYDGRIVEKDCAPVCRWRRCGTALEAEAWPAAARGRAAPLDLKVWTLIGGLSNNSSGSRWMHAIHPSIHPPTLHPTHTPPICPIPVPAGSRSPRGRAAAPPERPRVAPPGSRRWPSRASRPPANTHREEERGQNRRDGQKGGVRSFMHDIC